MVSRLIDTTAARGSRRSSLGEWNVGDGRRGSAAGPDRSDPARSAGGDDTDGPAGGVHSEGQRRVLAIDPRMRARRAQVQRERGRRRWQAVGVVAAVLVVAGAFVGTLHTGLLGLRHFRVSGAAVSSDARLLRRGGLRIGEPLIDVDISDAARRLEGLAWVSSAIVSRQWPTTVRVALQHRTAVAQVPTGPSTVGSVVLVDVTGRVLSRRKSPTPRLPVLLGVRAPASVGAWLAGSGGAGEVVGAPATLPPPTTAAVLDAAVRPVAAALALAEATRRADPSPSATTDSAALSFSRITVGIDGTLAAVVRGGIVTVVFGPPTSLAAKLTATETMLRAVPFGAESVLDVQVASRPTVMTGPPRSPRHA